MTMLALYESKTQLKAAIGQTLRYRETSMFGEEYRRDGVLTVAGRPPVAKREFFARVTMVAGRIVKVE